MRAGGSTGASHRLDPRGPGIRGDDHGDRHERRGARAGVALHAPRAVINANTNATSGSPACAAGSGVDTIVLPAGTITLAQSGAGEDAGATGDLESGAGPSRPGPFVSGWRARARNDAPSGTEGFAAYALRLAV